jgi:hypothetical protein
MASLAGRTNPSPVLQSRVCRLALTSEPGNQTLIRSVVATEQTLAMPVRLEVAYLAGKRVVLIIEYVGEHVDESR